MNIHLVEKQFGQSQSTKNNHVTDSLVDLLMHLKLHFNLTTHKDFQSPWKHFGPPHQEH